MNIGAPGGIYVSLEDCSQGLFEDIKIASPCPVTWDSMARTSDEAKRFCGDCRKHVYSIDKMNASDARALIANATQPESSVCVQLYRRADGTIITDDCPVGLRRIRKSWRQLQSAVASALLFLGILPALADNADHTNPVGRRTLGKIKMVPHTSPAPSSTNQPSEAAPLKALPGDTDAQKKSQEASHQEK
jgi:hypothetical protein